MVFCIVGLVIFGILGIFSAKYRGFAKEAFRCVFQTMTLRKCTTGFDEKMRIRISAKLAEKNNFLGKIVFTHFQEISLLFAALTIASLFMVGLGAYNLALYGNCNGPSAISSFCAFSPETYAKVLTIDRSEFFIILGIISFFFSAYYLSIFISKEALEKKKIKNKVLGIVSVALLLFSGYNFFFYQNSPSSIKMVNTEGLLSKGNADAPIKMIEVGCFTCPYTQQTEPMVSEILKAYEGKINFTFKVFPLPAHKYSEIAAEASACAEEQGKFWEFKDALFQEQLQCSLPEHNAQSNDLKAKAISAAKSIGLDLNQFSECLESGKYRAFIEKQKQDCIAAGIYGTPTFYINGKVVVAPKTKEELTSIIDGELKKVS